MKYLSFLLLAVTSFPLVVLAETPEANAPVGRYQITFAVEGLYFLDTATGALWHKKDESHWRRIDSPVNRSSNTETPPAKPVTLTLPKGGEVMPMVQREKRKIPGSFESLSVQLGDIAAGQVFVEVNDFNGHVVARRTSLKNKEFLKFTLNGKEIYLQVFDIVNNFLGDDICKVRISYEKPNRDQKKEKQKQAPKK